MTNASPKDEPKYEDEPTLVVPNVSPIKPPETAAVNLEVAHLGQLLLRVGSPKRTEEDSPTLRAKVVVGKLQTEAKASSPLLLSQNGSQMSQRGSANSFGKIKPEVIASRNKFIRFLDENSRSRETSRDLRLETPNLNSVGIEQNLTNSSQRFNNIFKDASGPAQPCPVPNQEDIQNVSLLTNGASQQAREINLSKKLDFTQMDDERLLWDTPPSRGPNHRSGIPDRLRTSTILDRLSSNSPFPTQNGSLGQKSNQKQPSMQVQKKPTESNPTPAVTYGFHEPRQLSLKNLSNNPLLVMTSDSEKSEHQGTLAGAADRNTQRASVQLPADPERAAGLEMLRGFEMQDPTLVLAGSERRAGFRKAGTEEMISDADYPDKLILFKYPSLENRDQVEKSFHSKTDSNQREMGKASNLSSKSYKILLEPEDILKKPHSQNCPEPDSGLLADIDLAPYLKSSTAQHIPAPKHPTKSEDFQLPGSPLSYCSSLRSSTTLSGLRPVLSEAKVQHPSNFKIPDHAAKASPFQKYVSMAADSPFPATNIGLIKGGGSPIKNFGQRASSHDFAS